ncbi:PhzF family phenazine biosynthesis protein [Nitzschia inconspicua]|uniref:PhzF family phenazine biosynthesis protein n=1 Tax=Nitzschia inconspicua TaxID=303405 RepID=A0A9K3Q3C3_9STRA|nr:PhzF family phenazine biosynthesis protein [Nitzschia inconspicua]
MSTTPHPPNSVEVTVDMPSMLNDIGPDNDIPMESEEEVADISHVQGEEVSDDFLAHLEYRKASPTDILKCVEIVKSSTIIFTPPIAGSSSKNALQYRQHHAAPYFRCAVYGYEGQEEHDEDHIIGYITGIRLPKIREDNDLVSTQPHDPTGPILAIRSVVIREEYRDRGLSMAMVKQYLQKIQKENETSLEHPISKIALLCHQEFLMFYIHCGFSVLRLANVSETKKEQDGDGSEPPLQLYYLEKLLIPPPAAVYESRRRAADQRELNCFIVDSFAAAPGGGNPAAVVILPASFDYKLKTKWMQMVAAEFNLAETAFCWPKGTRRRTDSVGSQGDESVASSSGKKDSHWNIRYYTPVVEMPLCGHATLASAAVLYQTLIPRLLLPSTAIVFHASEDVLTMRLADEDTASARVSKVSMDFPPKPPTELSTRDEKATVRNMLKSAFSIDLEPLFVGLSQMGDLLVELTPEAFNEIGYDSVNYKAFFEWDGYYRGVAICCVAPPDTEEQSSVDSTSDEGETSELHIDFLSRFFCPKAGINEDPVTGSAHCTLGPYFSEKLGKAKVTGRQMSARKGVVECHVTPDNITLTGTAITTMNGRLAM